MTSLLDIISGTIIGFMVFLVFALTIWHLSDNWYDFANPERVLKLVFALFVITLILTLIPVIWP